METILICKKMTIYAPDDNLFRYYELNKKKKNGKPVPRYIRGRYNVAWNIPGRINVYLRAIKRINAYINKNNTNNTWAKIEKKIQRKKKLLIKQGRAKKSNDINIIPGLARREKWRSVTILDYNFFFVELNLRSM